MEQETQREATGQVPLMLVLPKQLADVARTYAVQTGQTRNAVVLKAIREYLPALRRESERCPE